MFRVREGECRDNLTESAVIGRNGALLERSWQVQGHPVAGRTAHQLCNANVPLRRRRFKSLWLWKRGSQRIGDGGFKQVHPDNVVKGGRAMIIACATDRNFVDMCGVMMRSVVDRGDIPEAKFLVLGHKLTDEDRNNLAACVGGAAIRFIDVAKQIKSLAALPERIWPHVAFARIFAPDLVPDSGRMLYLDGDTVVNRSLRDLLDFQMQGHAIAAIPSGPLPHLKRVPDIIGFNSGVLLFDLDKWRARKLTTKVMLWPFAHKSIMKYPDQDALNAVIGGEFAELPVSYNLETKRAGQAESIAYEDAHIIHYTGVQKPNMKTCGHPARGVFLDSRSRTPWANCELYERKPRRKTFLDRVERFVQHGLAVLGLQRRPATE